MTQAQPSGGSSKGRTTVYAAIGLLVVFAATSLYSTYKVASVRGVYCGYSQVVFEGSKLPIWGNSLSALGSNKRLAYAFYAAQDDYHCACLVHVKRLIEFGRDTAIDLVIIIPHIYTARVDLLEKGQKLGVIYKHVSNLDVGRFTNSATSQLTGYYTGVMSKLHAFNMTEYDRVMFMDADQMLLKSPEALFNSVPDAMLAAPRAYWLLPGTFPKGYRTEGWPPGNGPEVGPQMKFGSYLMLIQPAEHLWSRLYSKYYKDGKPVFQDYFDMDLLNIEFKDDVTLLPGNLVVLSNDYMNKGADERPVNVRHIPQTTWFQNAYIMHFSAPGKVWSWTPARFNLSYPNAHDLLKQVWQTWWDVREQVC